MASNSPSTLISNTPEQSELLLCVFGWRSHTKPTLESHDQPNPSITSESTATHLAHRLPFQACPSAMLRSYLVNDYSARLSSHSFDKQLQFCNSDLGHVFIIGHTGRSPG